MAPLRYAAKFDPFLFLDCAPTPSTLAPPSPPPWHNPRKGRDQILPSGNTDLEYAKQPKDAQVLVPHARVRVGQRVGSPHCQPKVPSELETDVDDVRDE